MFCHVIDTQNIVCFTSLFSFRARHAAQCVLVAEAIREFKVAAGATNVFTAALKICRNGLFLA